MRNAWCSEALEMIQPAGKQGAFIIFLLFSLGFLFKLIRLEFIDQVVDGLLRGSLAHMELPGKLGLRRDQVAWHEFAGIDQSSDMVLDHLVKGFVAANFRHSAVHR